MLKSVIGSLVALGLVLVLSACGGANDVPAYTIADLPETASEENGRKIFENGASGAPKCTSCHTIDGEDKSTGPTLKGFANVAGSRVENETAREYSLNSIIAPGKHLAAGYGNVMYGSYGDKLSKQQVADLIEFLKTLE